MSKKPFSGFPLKVVQSKSCRNKKRKKNRKENVQLCYIFHGTIILFSRIKMPLIVAA